LPYKILEHSDGAVGSLLWLANERDILLNHRGVISLKVSGPKEQEDAATSLVADECLLVGSGDAGQKQGRRSIALRTHDNLTLVLHWLVRVFNQLKAELVDIEIDGFVVVANHESNMRDTLLQPGLRHQKPPTLIEPV
jgi:hypothetical protein